MSNSDTNREENWEKDCREVPLSGTNVSRPPLTRRPGRPRGLSRVFYNQRYNNNLRSDADYKRDGIQRRPHKNSLSDSSEGKEEGNYDNRQLSYQRKTASERYADPFTKEQLEDVEQSRQFENECHNGKQYQMYEHADLLTAKKQGSNTPVECVSTNLKSEADCLSLMTTVKKEHPDQHFPALATVTSGPNFWKDRLAFVSEARPVSENEEAEMIRRALELSRIEDEERKKREMEEEYLYQHLFLESSCSPDCIESTSNPTTQNTDFIVVERPRSEVKEQNVFSSVELSSPALSVQDPSITECQTTVSEGRLVTVDMSRLTEVTVSSSISPQQNCTASDVCHTSEEDSRFGDWVRSVARDSAVDVSFFPNGTLPQVIYREDETNSSDGQSPPDVIYQYPEDHKSNEAYGPEVVYFEARHVSPSVTPVHVVEDGPVLTPVYSPENDTQSVSDTSDLVSCNSVHYIPSAPDDFNQCSPIPSFDVCPSQLQCSSPSPVYMADPMQIANTPIMPVPMCSYPSSWLSYQMVPAPSFNPMSMCGGFPHFGNAMPTSHYGFSPGLVMPTTYPPPGLMPPPGLAHAAVGYPGFPPPVWFPHHGMPVPGYHLVSGAPMSPMFTMATVETGSEQKGVNSV